MIIFKCFIDKKANLITFAAGRKALGAIFRAGRTVPGRGDERAYGVARIIGFTGEHFVEHLGEIAAIKDNHGL